MPVHGLHKIGAYPQITAQDKYRRQEESERRICQRIPDGTFFFGEIRSTAPDTRVEPIGGYQK